MAYDIWQTCVFIPEIGQSACASWVQAWGTIAAIWCAVWVSRNQALAARKLEADKRHLDDLLKTEVVLQLFEEAAWLCKELADVPKQMNHTPPVHRNMQRVGELEQSFRSLPPFEIPGHGVAVGVLNAPKALLDLRLATQACIDAAVTLFGSTGVELPARTVVEFGRAHEHARMLANAGRLTCREQVQKLTALMPVQD